MRSLIFDIKILFQTVVSFNLIFFFFCRSNHSKKDKSVKYSGTRLREKGILIALDGVHPGQLKNVQFEISTTDFNGIYSVRGRFMGVEVEKIDIDIQVTFF